MVRNSENRGKRETHVVGHEIWRETLKNRQKQTHTVGPEIKQETVKNMKYEKHTL